MPCSRKFRLRLEVIERAGPREEHIKGKKIVCKQHTMIAHSSAFILFSSFLSSSINPALAVPQREFSTVFRREANHGA